MLKIKDLDIYALEQFLQLSKSVEFSPHHFAMLTALTEDNLIYNPKKGKTNSKFDSETL